MITDEMVAIDGIREQLLHRKTPAETRTAKFSSKLETRYLFLREFRNPRRRAERLLDVLEVVLGQRRA